MLNTVMKKELKESIIISILMIILGVVIYIKDIEFIDSIMNLIGLVCIAFSLILLILYFRLNENQKSITNDIFRSMVLFLVGAVFILKSEEFTQVIPVLIGAYFSVRNIGRLQLLLNLKNAKQEVSKSHYILTAISIVLCIWIILNPIDFHISLSKLIAIIIIATEIISIVGSIRLLKNIKEVKEATYEVVT